MVACPNCLVTYEEGPVLCSCCGQNLKEAGRGRRILDLFGARSNQQHNTGSEEFFRRLQENEDVKKAIAKYDRAQLHPQMY